MRVREAFSKQFWPKGQAGLNVNYRFVVNFARTRFASGKILDYGCGSGEIVRAGLEQGLDIYGCETFFGGGHGVEQHVSDLLGLRIFKIEKDRAPFADSNFDCIVNNQVFEHVEDMDAVLNEMNRVLKPGGALLSIFPSREVLREGHCGVPLAHRFSRYPRFDYSWLLAFRMMGLGKHKENKAARQWARDFQEYLNKYCIYRPEKQIMECFASHGLPAQGIEKQYIRFRGLPLFTPWMLRKFGMMVLLSRKQG